MKKTFKQKFSDLVLILLLNIPYLILILMFLDDFTKIDKVGSMLIAVVLWFKLSIDEVKFDELEERIKKLEGDN